MVYDGSKAFAYDDENQSDPHHRYERLEIRFTYDGKKCAVAPKEY